MKNKILLSSLMFVALIFVSIVTIDKETYLNYIHESISRILSNNGINVVFASRNRALASDINIDQDSSFFAAKIDSFKLRDTEIPELNQINLEIQPSSLLTLSPKIKLLGNILGDGILESNLLSNITKNSLSGDITLKQIPLSTIDKLKNLGLNSGILDASFSEINFISNPQNTLFSNFSISAKNISRPFGKSKDIPEIFSGFIPEISALNLDLSGNINIDPLPQSQANPNLRVSQKLKVLLKNVSIKSPLVEMTASGDYVGELTKRTANNKNLLCENSILKGNFKLSEVGLEKLAPLLPLISKTSIEIGTKNHSFSIKGCDFKFDLDSITQVIPNAVIPNKDL